MNRRYLSNSLVLFSGCEQSAQSLPTEAGGNWPTSSQHNICCYLIENILLREAGWNSRDSGWRREIGAGRKQDRLQY